MKALTTTFAILAFCTTLFAQSCTTQGGNLGGKTIKASKNYVTKELRVDDFNSIKLTGSPNVIYTQKVGRPQVEVYTSDNIVDLLDIHVERGTLYVGFRKNVSVSYQKLEVRISSERLNQIALSGSGDIRFANGLHTEDMQISLAGSGDIQTDNLECSGKLKISLAGSGDINARNLTCRTLEASVVGSGDMTLKSLTSQETEASVTGSGDLTLSGKTGEASYRVAGSGDLHASALEAQQVKASVSGSGDIRCHATQALKATVSGSGEIGYKGNPQQVEKSKKGVYRL